MDGRKFCARSGAAIATFITIAGLELVGAGGASAAPAPRTDNSLASAKALADHLASQAAKVGSRHAQVQTALDSAEKRLSTLAAGVQRERRTADALKAEVAGLAGDGSDVSQGTAAPAPTVTRSSATLLTNVVVVSEDTYGLAQRMATSDAAMASLAKRRAAVRQQVQTLRTREHTLAATESQLQQRANDASAHVTDLMGGPAVAYALSKVGNGYVFGASGPSVFDCSGLTMAAWSQAGVSLPHNAAAQYASGRHISESELQPGDLVFYYSPISHVGMYIGNGKIVNALNPGAGVVISGLHDLPFSGAVRPG